MAPATRRTSGGVPAAEPARSDSPKGTWQQNGDDGEPPPLEGEEYDPASDGRKRPTSYRTAKREMGTNIGTVGAFRGLARIPFLLFLFLLIVLYILWLNQTE